MATVLDLITASMQDLGAIALEETPSFAESNSAFNALNNMVDTWNTESLMVYNVVNMTFAYVANQATYTMGTGGNFNVARPIKIEAAYNRGNAGMTNQVDYPIYVTNNFEEYSNIITKRIETVLPTVMYDDGNFPLKNLSFWPIPADTEYAPNLWFWSKITSFATVSETIALPPGYYRALQKNLAVEIAPAYGREPSNTLMTQAIDSKAQIKRINYTVDMLSTPFGVPGTNVPPALPQFLSGYP